MTRPAITEPGKYGQGARLDPGPNHICTFGPPDARGWEWCTDPFCAERRKGNG